MPKFRVYSYYVGCQVHDVEAPDAETAAVMPANGGGVFLHEANEPLENPWFAEVHTYDADGQSSDDPVYCNDPEAAQMWHQG